MANIDKNVFVSHVHKDDAEVGKLKDLLGRQGFNIRDYSVTKGNPNNAQNEDYIKQQILKPRLDASSVLAVVITPETKDSKWVDWEVQYAIEHGKRIVGIWANGSKGVEIPSALKEVRNALVAWNFDAIKQALGGDNNLQQDCDGKQLPDEEIPTARCH